MNNLYRHILIVIILLHGGLNLGAQQAPTPSKKYGLKALEQKYKYDDSLAINRTFRLQLAHALSFFPELSDRKIEVRFKSIKTTMATRPRMDFVFKKKGSRNYVIYINTNKKIDGLLYHQLPFNAQIGIIGHELAHITDYKKRSAAGIVITGIRHTTSRNFKQKLENKVDEICISRGLGWQILDFSEFVFYQSNAPTKYKEYKKKFYYMPSEILNIMHQHHSLYKLKP